MLTAKNQMDLPNWEVTETMVTAVELGNSGETQNRIPGFEDGSVKFTSLNNRERKQPRFGDPWLRNRFLCSTGVSVERRESRLKGYLKN